MANHSDIGIIVLAAGQSRRFGSDDKRLAEMPDGAPLLDNTLNSIPDSLKGRILVLQPGDEHLASRYQDKWHAVYAQRAEQGMGESLAAGINAASDWQGALIALGDMPFIRADTYSLIQQQLQPDSIVLPRFQEKRGHPVGFGREFFPALSRIEGDQGAQSLLQQYLQHCHYLDVDDPGILQDIDTPEALE